MRGQRIVNLVSGPGKIHAAVGQNLHGIWQRTRDDREWYDLVVSLKACEEERLVLEDGSAERAPVLVGDLQSLGFARQVVSERVGVEN